MPTALHTPGRASQSHQGVGARLVRRLGGAVRSAIGSVITLAGARRPAVPQTCRNHAAAQEPEAPAPSQVRVPRRPRPDRPLSLPLPPLLARLLLTRRHRRPERLNRRDAPFTPEAYPQLSPKACAVLNTRVKDCDPKTLDLVVSTFAQYIREVMSPEAGITDHAATLPNLWHRISTALADTKADTSPATPEAVPADPADAVLDAPVVPPHPPVQAPPTGPRPSAKAAPPVSPVPLSGPPASDQPADATITDAGPRTPPDIAAPFGPVVHRSRSFRYHTQSFARSRRRHFHCYRHAFFPRGARDGPQCPPPWKLYYAACTGPP